MLLKGFLQGTVVIVSLARRGYTNMKGAATTKKGVVTPAAMGCYGFRDSRLFFCLLAAWSVAPKGDGGSP
jgi:hypothetical protein